MPSKYFIMPPTAEGAVPDVYLIDPTGDENHELVFSGTQEECLAFVAEREGERRARE